MISTAYQYCDYWRNSKNLGGKNESFKSTNYSFAVKALSEIRSIRKKDVMEQKGLLK